MTGTRWPFAMKPTFRVRHTELLVRHRHLRLVDDAGLTGFDRLGERVDVVAHTADCTSRHGLPTRKHVEPSECGLDLGDRAAQHRAHPPRPPQELAVAPPSIARPLAGAL